MEVDVSPFGPGRIFRLTLPRAPPSNESANWISAANLPPRLIERWPRDAPRSIVAAFGFALVDDEPRRRIVTGSLKLTSEAFLMKCLDRISFGFFLMARFSCLRTCAFWCFVSFADAGATTTALSANTTASMTPKKLRVCLEDTAPP